MIAPVYRLISHWLTPSVPSMGWDGWAVSLDDGNHGCVTRRGGWAAGFGSMRHVQERTIGWRSSRGAIATRAGQGPPRSIVA